ncbi:hypothetical protein A2U01_0007148 [Trifolium medium]|uniref:Uncharacterized protein n=1 Tax=Trifolium medium TaxID=97028 RepID=A0A392MJ65_9FABA|nr:hypothetical protein [Trifolium medium]
MDVLATKQGFDCSVMIGEDMVGVCEVECSVNLMGGMGWTICVVREDVVIKFDMSGGKQLCEMHGSKKVHVGWQYVRGLCRFQRCGDVGVQLWHYVLVEIDSKYDLTGDQGCDAKDGTIQMEVVQGIGDVVCCAGVHNPFLRGNNTRSCTRMMSNKVISARMMCSEAISVLRVTQQDWLEDVDPPLLG